MSLDDVLESALRSLFGWCVLLFAMASVSGVMEWNGAYMVFQSVCFGICVLGVTLYFAWIVLYGLRQ